MSRVLFLDFDGVVVCLPRAKGKLDGGKSVRNANPECVPHLNRIVDATGCAVVVSSSWRLHHPIPYLQGTLERVGFAGKVIDVTPEILIHKGTEEYGGACHHTERGWEVALWLQMHPEITSYVVLDDEGDRGPIPSERWVLVEDGWSMGGLQLYHAERAIATLFLPLPTETTKERE